MVTDILGSILQELSTALQIPNLQPDKNNSCLIKFKNGQEIQMEMDKSGQFLILGTTIGHTVPGRYRENIFREALRANHLAERQHGVFAYSKQSDTLILFQMIPIQDLTGEKVSSLITPMMERARVWVDAISRGDTPPVEQSTISGRSGMFGL